MLGIIIELCCDVVKMAENLCSTVAGTFPNVVK